MRTGIDAARDPISPGCVNGVRGLPEELDALLLCLTVSPSAFPVIVLLSAFILFGLSRSSLKAPYSSVLKLHPR